MSEPQGGRYLGQGKEEMRVFIHLCSNICLGCIMVGILAMHDMGARETCPV